MQEDPNADQKLHLFDKKWPKPTIIWQENDKSYSYLAKQPVFEPGPAIQLSTALIFINVHPGAEQDLCVLVIQEHLCVFKCLLFFKWTQGILTIMEKIKGRLKRMFVIKSQQRALHW